MDKKQRRRWQSLQGDGETQKGRARRSANTQAVSRRDSGKATHGAGRMWARAVVLDKGGRAIAFFDM